ncbi:Outer membrane receptor proteins, mostly Fe transport [Pedobacter westerhofensis]|uniref:Outer membrane receptor proteins, mostly Fe transport n=1 Tax=Pedobacter westerhofensis TaxID=425512 RepID=A0A521AIA3_9SPHI|nr:TonB-dependent receptor [Pedobacter westerhofensis]SMO34513.1 Outer membrane receptor proteins, mostly Fe transport [Pedobacter westerhofensis]
MIISLLSKKKYAVYPNKHLKLITFLIVFLSINKISRSQAQSGTVTVNYKNCTAQQLLKELDRQSPYTFFFDPGQMNGLQLQSISYKNVPIKTVLEDLEKRANLSFSILNSNISVSLVTKVPVKKPEPGKLTGKILDEKGETFPSAGIRVAELGTGMQSSVDGTYILPLPPGTYTIEISYVSYQTQRITGVQIKPGAVTKLDVSMRPAANALKEVVVTSGFQRASAAGLYARQKTAAGITDGISAAQIARTPDNNVGAVLKRVSGLNVVDNRYVVVRGLSDRYNQAQIDGVTQPSTEMNQRNFAFDAIPAEMVSSVVVNKTATPDISSEFAGGQVSVNTLDIPVQDFTQFQIGSGYNSNTIGKDFLQAGKRGGAEVIGFMNDRHKLPPGLRSFVIGNTPVVPGYVTAQSRAFDPEGFRIYRYGFQPNQNYRFTLGRTYQLKHDVNFGFVGGFTLRNNQEIHDYISTRAGFTPKMIDSIDVRQNGTIYKFNSSLSGLLNLGIQGKGFKMSLRNMYSHVYKNDYYIDERGNRNDETLQSIEFKNKFNLQSPENTIVLQHKLESEHTLGESGVKLTWNGSYTNVNQTIDDRRKFQASGSGIVNGKAYYQIYSVANPYLNDGNPDYRLYTDTREKDYNWGINLSRSFDFLYDNTLIKIGYSGFNKKRNLSNSTIEIFNNSHDNLIVGPYDYSLSPELLGTGPGQVFYNVPASSGEQFSGKASSNSGYAMLDQKFFKKLRLVYGIRYENYKLSNTQFKSRDQDVNKDDNKNYLPSANLTYSFTESLNFRASYAKTVVRPDFRETSIFGLYDPILDARIEGSNVKSTIINNSDIRFEWYPTPGEIISLSGFYKKFDKPIELVFLQDAAVDRYGFQNQKSAENYGLEMEFRKSLRFIADRAWLRNLSLFGNGTLIRSKVRALEYTGAEGKDIRELSVKRALFGQSPWIVNAGIAYTKHQYGLNVVYNRSGYRTNTINYDPAQVEYEMGRDLVDLQIFTRLFKQKGEFKLNVSNLLNAQTFFYKNWDGYDGQADKGFTKKEGKSDGYKKEEGDFITYKVKTGTNVSAAFTYRF